MEVEQVLTTAYVGTHGENYL